MDRPPDLRGYDVGIFYLSGRFDNESDKPLKVELKAPLPDACFPEGRASRTFTARPKAVTQFRILTGVNVDNAAHALGGRRSMTIQIQSDGGDVLAEQSVMLLMDKPGELKPQVIGSLTGGTLTLRITNATDRACVAAINMTPPPGVKIPSPDRSFGLAAGAQVLASFPIPRQVFKGDGVRRIPYRVAVAGGTQQHGETVADLEVQSRWWVKSRVEALSEFGVPGEFPRSAAAQVEAKAAATRIFQAAAPPEGWELVTCGKSVEFGKFAKLLSPGSVVTAVARVTAPADGDVVLSLPDRLSRESVSFVERIWFNDAVVYESRIDGEGEKRRKLPKSKPFRVNRGENTILVECLWTSARSGKPADITLQFSDEKTGKQFDGLVFDIWSGR